MSRKYKFYDNDKLYIISFATVYGIDVFARDEYLGTIVNSWKFCQQRKRFLWDERIKWIVL
ncbi:MAG: hypothetical protein ABI091_23875 [Ferruginibacter sp.]